MTRRTPRGPSLKVGDEVRIFDVNGKRYGQPDDGYPATVVKVGTKLVTLRRIGHRDDEVFRIEEQTKNNGWGHESFLTMAQVGDRAVRRRCVEVMKSHGITVHSLGGSIPTEKLVAVAGALAVFDQPDAQPHRHPARPRS